uniref:NADH-ubiquinone oxidoreductase chain 4 n=1 Tax=Tychobythinus sp. 1 EF-2015 TaxID=1756873 RepID=A0A0S2M976_9COLE|nr:NADH deshydrogenase subunit 4 [Tychobythinus sp. 1 EF-2015]
MMKFLIMMMFMIPLNFLNKYWLIQCLYFYVFFMYMLNYGEVFNYLNINSMFGVDLLSYLMILLSFWICSLMILASNKIFKKKVYFSFFLFILNIMMIFLYCAFSAINLFIFYLYFEMSLIPMLIMIMGWGYQPERLQAGIYLLFYTLFASLPMMISIFYVYFKNSSLLFLFLSNNNNIFIYIFMNMVFFIKMPMFMVHLWLPKAHVEAPISGSMILAGVLLKLGSYGLIRLEPMFLGIGIKINLYIITISLLGSVIISMICFRQTDIKSLIAYSSIVHMGLVLSGILSLNYWGVCGAIIMMIAHGLCSSGLFCLANISYERVLSRSLFLNKGLINLLPSLSLWWFLFNMSNMAAPPSLNLLGEIILLNSLISWNYFNILSLIFISFFSAVYSLYLYCYSQHGKISFSIYSFSMGFISEYLLLMLHWVPLNLLILKSD